MSTLRRRLLPLCLIAFAIPVFTTSSGAQVGKFLKDVTKNAVKRETAQEINRRVAKAFHCVFDDPNCFDQAQARGEDVVFVDENGNVINGADGQPVMNPKDLPPQYQRSSSGAGRTQAAAPNAPAGNVNVNSEFQPGKRTIFYDDYSGDNIGDFPRDMELVKGNWDVVEWQGHRLLRNTGPRGAAIRIRLPEVLPEKFTIETEVYFPHGNQQAVIFVSDGKTDEDIGRTKDQYFQIAGNHSTGITARRNTGGVESMAKDERIHQQLVPVDFMMDGEHLKCYVGEHRVCNAPNVKLPRERYIQIENTYFANEEYPMYFGPIRIAAGGLDMYQAIEQQGRVAVHDILFDTDQATIKSESADTLNQISQMLQEHPGLNLMIEGHTDSTGDFDHNMDLSRERAASVKNWLVSHGTDPSRLRTMGLGSTQPKASNETEEGRQENRRVELVKIG